MKTLAKYFCSAVGIRWGTSSQKWPKTYLTYITDKTPNQKIFFVV